MTALLAICLVTLTLSWWFSTRLARPDAPFYVASPPNERSLHQKPVPHSGGIAILASVAVTWLIIATTLPAPTDYAWVIAGLAIIVAVSFVDDRKHLAPSWRLSAHLLAAIFLTIGGYLATAITLPGEIVLNLGIISAPLCVAGTIWMINLYNFMDGMDAFAGGMSVFGFGTFALLGWLADQELFALLSAAVAAANLGFLFVNFPPARLFMGDVGSASLGYLAATFILWAARENFIPLWISLLLFSPFIMDATITLGYRAVRRKPVWQPHREHYYQRLVRLGWGHRKTVLWEYLLMTACAVSAIIAIYSSITIQWLLMGIWLLIYSALALLIPRLGTTA